MKLSQQKNKISTVQLVWETKLRDNEQRQMMLANSKVVHSKTPTFCLDAKASSSISEAIFQTQNYWKKVGGPPHYSELYLLMQMHVKLDVGVRKVLPLRQLPTRLMRFKSQDLPQSKCNNQEK